MLNPSDTDAAARIELFDWDGRKYVSSNETIPARRRKSPLLTEFFPHLKGQDISSGYIRVTSDRGLASFALFGTQSLTVLSAVPAITVL
jgi:hypothetical protein